MVTRLVTENEGREMARIGFYQNQPGLYKMTRTIAVDPDQHQELSEAAQASGQTVSEVITAALTEWVTANEAPEGGVTQA
jgi:hypothetical protein